MNENKTTPRIYVACLAAYNSGKLHGEWIDCTRGEDRIWKEIKSILRRSPIPHAEEHAIHDYEGFAPVKIAEYHDISKVAELGAAIAEHGSLFSYFYEHYESSVSKPSVEDAIMEFKENYGGEWDSLADYTEQFWRDTSPELFKQFGKDWWHPLNYVDWERMGKELETNGDIYTIQHNGKIHIFQS